MAKIGIMGGTFDPIHNGHLMIGRQAYEEYHLDEVWFMPSGTPPHKKDHKITEEKDRCAMVNLAISDSPFFRLSDFEVKRAGNTYTAETLRLLAQEYPEHQFYFIIGADSLFQIERWYHPEDVMRRTTLMVAGRDYPQAERTMDEQIAFLEQKYGAGILKLHCEEMDVASAELRKAIAKKESIERYVPAAVAEYIIKNKLYDL